MATRCMAKVVWKVIGLNPGLLSGAVGGAAWCGARQAAALVMDRVGSHGFAAEVDTSGLWSFYLVILQRKIFQRISGSF